MISNIELFEKSHTKMTFKDRYVFWLKFQGIYSFNFQKILNNNLDVVRSAYIRWGWKSGLYTPE